jgi:predicted Zn-dependent protease
MCAFLPRAPHRRAWALVGLVAIVACATAPYTKRSQLILLSSDEEAKLGTQAFQEVVSKSRLVSNPALTGPVEEVGRRIARVADRPDFKWRFAVIDDAKQVNAFCLPGGKVAVYTGMFPVAKDTGGLAVVMGHEIAHAIARHGAERMSQATAAQAGGSLLGAWLGGSPSSQAILAAYGLGAQVGVLLPYGRAQESEADHIGLILMARAGYDPTNAIAFWRRMEGRSRGQSPPEFLSTHPGHGTRERQISAWLPEAQRYRQAVSAAPVVALPGAR